MNVNSQWFGASVSSRTSLRGPNVARIGVGHALIDNCSSEKGCASIIAHAQDRGKPAYVITSNAQHILSAGKGTKPPEITDHADLVIPDGVFTADGGAALRSFAATAGRRRQYIQGDMRAGGEDRSACLFAWRPAGVRRAAATAMQGDYPGLRCSTYCPPLGFERSAESLQQTAEAIRAAQPDILFVAFGAPEQEYWIYEHGLQLSVPVCIGVGGTFEIVGGVVPRAPMWAQNIGCEWLYRLCREPRRMWRRYLIGNLEFASIILRQRVRRSFFDAFVHCVNENRFAAELSEVALLQHNRAFDARSNIRPREVEGLATPLYERAE